MTRKSLTERYQERVITIAVFPLLGIIAAGVMGYPVEDVFLVFATGMVVVFFIGTLVAAMLDARRAMAQGRRIATVTEAATEQIDAAVATIRDLWKHEHSPEDLDAAIRAALEEARRKLS